LTQFCINMLLTKLGLITGGLIFQALDIMLIIYQLKQEGGELDVR